jgi:hypothetical protein
LDLTINFEVSGTGWAKCTLHSAESVSTITASYLSDALRRLVLAATAVVSGFSQVTFCFDEEPGEYRWIISSPRINEVTVDIRKFGELWGERPDADGEHIFQTKCLPVTFASAVSKAANTVLASMGESEYAEKWSEHPFPTAQLQELDRLLFLEERVA